MGDLDDADDPAGAGLRDLLDLLWLKLPGEDRAALDARTGDASRFAGTLGPRETGAADVVPGSPSGRRDLRVRRAVRANFRRP